MKKLYMWLAVIMPIFLLEAQNLQNANWDFGSAAALRFLPSPHNPGGAVTLWNTQSGCGSVSDQSGNRLFFTNGQYISSTKNSPSYMPNGKSLKGEDGSTQGVIIVPKPGDSDNYYVVTLSGVSLSPGGGTDPGFDTVSRKGLYYNEVDMALNGGLGDVIVGKKNIPLKDHNGVYIDESYTIGSYIGNYSEKLTSTVHSNGIDYWIVTQIDRYVYSYKVTSSGISLVPNSYTQTYNTVTNDLLSGVGGMKISPDTQRIAIAYHDGVYNIEKILLPGDVYPGVVLGSFNNTIGRVVLDEQHPIIVSDRSPYGVEFSPNSKYVYFSANQRIYYTASQFNTLNYVSIDYDAYDLQLGIDNRIYFPMPYAGGEAWLGVINNPNNILAPAIADDAFLYDVGTSMTLSQGLPQWIYWQQSGCTPIVTLTTANNVTQGQNNRQASNTLNAANIITENGSANYHAGTTVVLKPGFHSANGSSFRGYIEGCNTSGTLSEIWSSNNSRIAEEPVDLFTLSPNPAADRTTIASDKVMAQVEVKSLTGTVFFSSNVNDKSYELYIGNYPKGFYLVTVITDTGEVEVKKLIKD